MTNSIIKLTNAEINALVMEYKETQTDVQFNLIFDAVSGLATKLGYKAYNKYKGLAEKSGYTSDDFVSSALIAVHKASKVYDIEKGADFTSLVKQLVEWTIQDEIIKKSQTLSAQFNSATLSLDKPVNESTDFLEAIEHQHATDIEDVFNAVLESFQDEQNLGGILTGLANDFSCENSSDDSIIIKTWVATILTVDNASKKIVNQAIETALPQYKADAIRKKKSRAVKRFNDFAVNSGYPSFDLSQF